MILGPLRREQLPEGAEAQSNLEDSLPPQFLTLDVPGQVGIVVEVDLVEAAEIILGLASDPCRSSKRGAAERVPKLGVALVDDLLAHASRAAPSYSIERWRCRADNRGTSHVAMLLPVRVVLTSHDGEG